jgi:hypothetical protein
MPLRAFSRASLCLLTTLVVGSVDDRLLTSAHAAGRPAISIGDVKVAEDAGASSDAVPELGRALRAALGAELERATWGTLKRPVVVSATLTQLSSERTKASATISIALSRADDRVLLAELRGRASVEEASGNLASLRRAALQGAVHGAVSRLPEAVQRARP